MRTIQVIGVPDDRMLPADAEAVVVALKSRTAPAAEAVAQSLAACRWLRQAGARQIYLQVLLDLRFDGRRAISARSPMRCAAELGADFTTVCPAFPENGRTIYQGHLFVGDVLLSDSPMRNHPLTPMTDANLVRVLGRQTRAAVGLVPYRRGAAGSGGDPQRPSTSCARRAIAYAVVDAIEDERPAALSARPAPISRWPPAARAPRSACRRISAARACWRRAAAEETLPPVGGAAAVLSGSCSPATLAQVARMTRAASSPACSTRWHLAERGEAAMSDALAWAAAEPAGWTGPDLCQRAAGGREVGAGEARPRPRRRAWSNMRWRRWPRVW